MSGSEMKILYGLSLETSEKLKAPLEQELERKGKSLQTVCRYRKEGVYQYAKDQDDDILMILEENLQSGSPYEKDELMQLTDIRENRIIFLLDREHFGDDYIKTLFACGIYDALFLDEADARKIMTLLKKERTNAEAREYYGIETARDREKTENIANTKYLNAYLEFVETGMIAEDVDQKYRFAASRLSPKENKALATSLPAPTRSLLQGNELYQFYIGSGKKKRSLLGIGRKEKQDTESFTQALSEEVRNIPSVIAEERGIVVSVQNDREAQIMKDDLDNREEDMLQVMDRYRTCYMESIEDSSCVGDEIGLDMCIAMGEYLRQIDT